MGTYLLANVQAFFKNSLYCAQQSVQQHTNLLSWTKCYQRSKRHASCPWTGVRQTGSLIDIYVTTFYRCLLEGYTSTCSPICPITDKPDIYQVGTCGKEHVPLLWHLLPQEFPTDPSPLPAPQADSSMICQDAISYSLASPQHIMWFSFSPHQLFILMYSPCQATPNQLLQTGLYYLWDPRLLITSQVLLCFSLSCWYCGLLDNILCELNSKIQ